MTSTRSGELRPSLAFPPTYCPCPCSQRGRRVVFHPAVHTCEPTGIREAVNASQRRSRFPAPISISAKPHAPSRERSLVSHPSMACFPLHRCAPRLLLLRSTSRPRTATGKHDASAKAVAGQIKKNLTASLSPSTDTSAREFVSHPSIAFLFSFHALAFSLLRCPIANPDRRSVTAW
jgi:hypothetical protein